jgi:adenine-specific DNA-methyltransferase
MKLAAIENPRSRQEELGQFLTATPVADFMASMFGPLPRTVRLLDAGAGAGSLTAAFVSCCCEKRDGVRAIEATLYELDPEILDALSATMHECEHRCAEAGIRFTFTIHLADFIQEMSARLAGDLFGTLPPAFDVAIANPPYRKISTDSAERRALRSVGVETSNLYTGFIALIQRLLVPGGQLVGITPRSFCNGPYFRPFREDFLSHLELRRLHVFDSRQAAFRDDRVLQENIIFHAVKGRNQPDEMLISSSSGQHGDDITETIFPFAEIVHPHDAEKFIHIPSTASHATAKATMDGLRSSLASLGVTVSTGRVVDFRLKDALRKEPEPGTVPLLYPCHFNGGTVHWPKLEARKPNAILDNDETRPRLVPSGVYLLTKRFRSKEERRHRVTARTTSKRNAPRWVNASCLRENLVQLQFQVRARNRVHEDKAELGFEALRNQHLGSRQTEEIAPKIRSYILLGGLDFAHQDLA